MRDWWLRTLLVLQRPRPVFQALRDDSNEAAAERSEQVLLIVWLAGIAGVLVTGAAASLMDNIDYTPIVVAIWAFIAGGIYGAFGYFFFGALLYAGVRAFGSQCSYRRTRHVLAFAAVPLALSLVLWPLKLALWGDDVFRRGGDDSGAGADALALLTLAFGLWALILLLIGVRAVHGWTWPRAGGAVVVAAVLPVLVVAAASAA